MMRLFEPTGNLNVVPETYIEYATEESKDVAAQIVSYMKTDHRAFEETINIGVKGRIKTIHVKGTVVYDEHQIPVKMLGVDMDISELIKAGEAIREHLYFIQQIAHSSPYIITVMNLDTHALLYMNGSCAETTGYGERVSLMNNPMLDVIAPSDVQAMHDHIHSLKYLSDGEVVEHEYRVIDPEGNIRWFRDRNSVFKRDPNGVPVEKIGFSHEITSNKKAMLDLKEVNERFQAAIDVAPMVLCILRAIRDGGNVISDFAFDFVSRSGEQLAGKDLTGSTLLAEFPHIKSAGVFDGFINTVENGEPCDVSHPYETGGSELWIRWRAVKFEAGLFVSIENITARVKAEKELIDTKLQKQKDVLNAIILTQEQERERIGEALHNGVAQLLYAIQTRLQLLQTNDVQDQKYISEIMNIVGDAINDTRQISFELVPAVLKDFGIEVALRTLLHRIIKTTLRIEMRLKGIEKHLPENLEFAVYRIVQELVNNILKHSKATGASIDISRKRKNLILTITDNGIGLKEPAVSDLEKGIGLQTVRNRVRLLGGKIKIHSVPGAGTSVSITLPVLSLKS
jgi:PAS domain S-box-containing protein